MFFHRASGRIGFNVPLWHPRFLPELDRFYNFRKLPDGYERLEMPFHTIEAAQIIADLLNEPLKFAAAKTLKRMMER